MWPENLPERLSEASVKRHQRAAEKRAKWFIKGPLPVPWFSRAASLPGKALHVGLAIWLETGRTRSTRVRLSAALLSHFHVSRQSAYRALKALESAGLVTVVRHSGRNPLVTVRQQVAQPRNPPDGNA